MGWVTWAKDMFWGNGLIGKTVSAGAEYTFGTVSYLFEQIGVLPKTIRSLIKERRSRAVVDHLAYVVGHDLLPLILVNTAHTSLQQALASDYEEDAAWFDGSFLLYHSLALLQCAVAAYNLRQGMQMTTRTLLISLKAPDAFNQINPREHSPLCSKEKCTVTKHIKGSGRELIEFMANDLAVYLMSQLSGMAMPSQMLSIYGRGRYIVKSTTPERCPDHRGIKSEHALALGLGHEVMVQLVNAALSSTVGLPPEFCLKTIHQMLLIVQIAIAAHMQPPIERPGEGTFPVDVMDAYEKVIGWSTRVVASGLMKQIPPLLRGPRTEIPWQKIVKGLQTMTAHPLMHQGKKIALPGMYQSTTSFINDPVIKTFWSSIQAKMDKVLTFILDINDERPITSRLAAWAPKTTAGAIKVILGIPKPLTKGLIILIGNNASRQHLESLRYWIRSLNIDAEVQLVVSDRPNLREQELPRQALNASTRSVVPVEQLLEGREERADSTERLFSRKKETTVNRFFQTSREAKKNNRVFHDKSPHRVPQPSTDDLLGTTTQYL